MQYRIQCSTIIRSILQCKNKLTLFVHKHCLYSSVSGGHVTAALLGKCRCTAAASFFWPTILNLTTQEKVPTIKSETQTKKLAAALHRDLPRRTTARWPSETECWRVSVVNVQRIFVSRSISINVRQFRILCEAFSSEGTCAEQLTSLVECQSFVQTIIFFLQCRGRHLPVGTELGRALSSISDFMVWSILLLFLKLQMYSLRFVADNQCSSLKLDIG